MDRRSVGRFLLPALLLLTVGTTGCFFFPRRTASPGAVETRQAPGSIKGVALYMDTRRPAVGVSVSLLGTSTVAVTDEQGRFVFPAVPPGWQTVYASKEQYLTCGETVDLDGAQTAEITFLLQPTEGHLHGASSRVPGLCGSCHVLHQQPAMLGGSANAPCFNCHQGNYPRMSNQAIYNATLHSASVAADDPSPVKLTLGGKERGECVNCHEPHGINNSHRHLLTVAAPESSNPLCYSCHSQPGSGHTKNYPGQTVCEASDNPHMKPNSTRPDLLTIYPGSEAEAGECYNCHNPHGATKDGTSGGQLTTAMTRNEEGKLCVTCHTYWTGRPVETTKHACSLCHNPHLVKKGGVVQVKKPGSAAGELVAVTGYQGTHRLVSKQLTNDYCLGCHNNNPGNPYAGRAKVPDAANTNFKNITTESLPNANYRDLHKVHVVGPIGDDDGIVTVGNFYATVGYGTKRNGSCYPGGYHEGKGAVPKTPENKVWCIQCHDVHPNPATPGNQRGRLLRTNLITTATVTSNGNGTGYNGKGACSMNTAFAPCHAGHDRNNKYTGCDWCHAGNGGSPGYACDCTAVTCAPYSTWAGGECDGNWEGIPSGFQHGSSHFDAARTTGRRPVML
ncbi:MAG: cytochrome c3 family protein [Chitinophagales bacterium]